MAFKPDRSTDQPGQTSSTNTKTNSVFECAYEQELKKSTRIVLLK